MSYSNYSTYLKYKNCCRPIGDTGPPGPAGPTGPAATLDVPGNKGEILYFSETNTLDSPHTIFITNGNVTINNNLVVTGNLSMDDNFINDVSGIYFSDNTYIGHGSSFDITTSETLDISASGGISVTGNLTVKDATTVNKTLNVVGNTTLENLFVNGYINNLIEISGNTIQPIISESVNLGYDESGSSNDKRFNLGFFNKIKSRTAVIVGNLSMDDSFINDVSGIYFSDGTFIGHGSSFDITTSETLDISAAGGISTTGNLIVNDIANFQSDINLSSNTSIFGSAEFMNKSYFKDGFIAENGVVNFKTDLNIEQGFGNLIMGKNFINDVSGIYFSDGTFIGHGSSFDITTSETLDISAAGGISTTGNLIVNDAADFQSDINLNGNLIFNDGPSINRSGSSINVYANNFNIASIVTNIKSNLSMYNNFINDVSGIYFTQGNLLFSDFSSVYQSVQLPSSQGQPISLERKTLFYQPSYNNPILSGNIHLIEFNKPLFNQLDLSFVGNIIKPSPDISGQFIELYANFDVSSQNQTTLEFDISGIVATSGTPFKQTIDVRSITKDNISFYLTFGPHIFIPSEWSNTTEFVFKLFNSGNFAVDINEYKLMFKSYFM